MTTRVHQFRWPGGTNHQCTKAGHWQARERQPLPHAHRQPAQITQPKPNGIPPHLEAHTEMSFAWCYLLYYPKAPAAVY